MENMLPQAINPMDEVRVPKFSLLSGIGAIVTYLFASLPVIFIASIFIAFNSVDSSSKNNKLDSNVLSDKLNDLVKNPSFLVLILAVNCAGLFFYAFLVSRIRGTKNMRKDFGITFSLKSILFVFLGIGLQIATLIITIPISIIRDNENSQQEIASDLANAKGATLIIFAIFVAFIVPFAEELCFRGMFLRGLLKKTSPVVAILISGILFALVHLSDPNAIYGFSALMLVGIISSALATYRGKIDASIALHVGFNLTAVVFLIFS